MASVQELLKLLDSQEPGGLYLLFGEEEYLKEQALSRITEKVDNSGFSELNTQTLEGRVELSTLIECCETLPFMADRRLVTVKDFSGLSSDGAPSAAEKKEIEHFISTLSPTTCLVFCSRGEVSASNFWRKTIAAKGQVIDCKKPTALETARLIAAMAEQRGGKMSVQAATFLMDYTGFELSAMQAEVDKLCAFANGAPIQKAEIQAICSPGSQYKVFKMIDSLISGNTDDAYRQYALMLEGQEPPQMLISLIGRQLNGRLRAYDCRAAGIPTATASRRLGVPAFVLDSQLKNGRLRPAQLRRGVGLCARLDAQIREGTIGENEACELLIASLCMMTRPVQK